MDYNHKNFYGAALRRDPALMTNARNFEFQHVHSATVENALDKVQNANAKKTQMLQKYCNNKSPAVEAACEKAFASPSGMEGLHKANHTREMSDFEIENLIERVKSTSHTTIGDGVPSARASTQRQKALPHLQKLTVEHSALPAPQWVCLEEHARGHASVEELETDPLPTDAAQEADYCEEANEHVRSKANSTASLYSVDSDLEFEMLGRASYTRYCGERPDESGEMAEEAEANFVEFEPQIPDMSMVFLKNTASMRFTETTDETYGASAAELNLPAKKLHKKKSKTKVQKHKHNKSAEQHLHEIEERLSAGEELHMLDAAASGFFLGKQPSLATAECAWEHKTTPKPQKNAHTKKKHAASEKKQAPAAKTTPTLENKHAVCQEAASGKEISPRSKGDLYNFSPRAMRKKQISPRQEQENAEKQEQLLQIVAGMKRQKINIFKRIFFMQEQIVMVIGQMGENLAEIYEHGDEIDTARRRKNAFEFSVRFSRNFLYPLRAMLHQLKRTKVEQFVCSTSNDACQRVVTIYNLLLQSLQTFLKQMGNYLLEQISSKLRRLFELLETANQLCLEKGVFDRHDAKVKCLIQTSRKFVAALNELESVQTAELQTAGRTQKRTPPSQLGSKYNLKMCMNDYNMYEPKLVPKVSKKGFLKREQIKRNSKRSSTFHSNRQSAANLPDIADEQPPMRAQPEAAHSQVHLSRHQMEDRITTQMQVLEESQSSRTTISSTKTTAKNNSAMSFSQASQILELAQLQDGSFDKTIYTTVVQALQYVTADHVRKVLAPIIRCLSHKLDKQGNVKAVEKILNVLGRELESKLTANSGCSKTTAGSEQQEEKQEQVDYMKEAPASVASVSHSRSRTTESSSHSRSHMSDAKSSQHHMPPQRRAVAGAEVVEPASHSTSRDRFQRANTFTMVKSKEHIPAAATSSSPYHLQDDGLYTAPVCPSKISQHSQQRAKFQQQLLQRAYPNLSSEQLRRISNSGTSHPSIFQTASSTTSGSNASNSNVSVTPTLLEQQRHRIQRHAERLTGARKAASNCGSKSSRNTLHRKPLVTNKCGNPLKEPPPPPKGTPTVSPSASKHGSSNAVEELPHAMTHAKRSATLLAQCCPANQNSNNNKRQSSNNNYELMTSVEEEQHDVEALPPGIDQAVYTISAALNSMTEQTQQCAESNRGHIVSNVLAQCLQNAHLDPEEFLMLPPRRGNGARVAQSETLVKQAKASTRGQTPTVSAPHLKSFNVNSNVMPNKSMAAEPKPIDRPGDAEHKHNFDDVIAERQSFLEQCKKNRFYENPSYQEPWKIFAKISEELVKDVAKTVEQDFSAGVSNFVHEFLQMERQH